MSTYRYGYEAPFARSKERGPNGRLLCRMCGQEVPKGRRTWCSQQCVDECNEKTGYYVRSALEKRDCGVCAQCGLDTRAIKALGHELLYEHEWPRHQLIRFLKRLDIDPGASLEYWHADHIVAVSEGGGPDLENMRTLCVGCHKHETRELHGRLKKKRWKERTGQEELAF